MEKICMDILEQWAEYVNYDEDQKQFNLANFSYETHKVTKSLKHIIEDYDSSGLLAVLKAKHLFFEILNNSRISLFDALMNPNELGKHKSMYDAFCRPEISLAEKNYIEKLQAMVQKVLGKELIGNFDEEFTQKVFDHTDAVITSLDKCRVDVYKRGGKLNPVTHYSSGIRVFPSLAECLLAFDNAGDGMYLCYIDVNHSSDGYFAFIVKNNGNLFSVNERIGEVYIGQHKQLRNGRRAEGKADEIFPYDYIFQYGDYDYKGYSHEYNIDTNRLAMADMGEDAYLPLLIAMMLLSVRLKDNSLDQYPQTYLSSFLSVNVPLLGKDEHALAVIKKNELVQATNAVNLEFDYNKMMSGEALKEFYEDRPQGIYSYVTAHNNNQFFVDLYGDGFEIKPDIISAQKLISDGKQEYIQEFVGTEYRFREQAYYEIRKQLAKHIRAKMYEEYKAFGGMEAVKEWFGAAVMENKEKFRKLAARHYMRLLKGEVKANVIEWQPDESEPRYYISMQEGKNYLNAYAYGFPYLINKGEHWYRGTVWDLHDDDTGNTCNLLFIFRPRDWKGIEHLLGREVPKIIKGWNKNGHDYSGNPLLDITDAVEKIGTPFEYIESRQVLYDPDRTYTEFSICIGFSKRGIKALCKSYGYKLP